MVHNHFFVNIIWFTIISLLILQKNNIIWFTIILLLISEKKLYL